MCLPCETTSSVAQAPIAEEPYMKISRYLWELDRITGHILLAQAFARSEFAEVCGVSSSTVRAELSAATHFEERLSKLLEDLENIQCIPSAKLAGGIENSGNAQHGPSGRLPDAIENPRTIQYTPSRRIGNRKLLFRIRHTHAKTLLFRPMLARLCFVRSQSNNTAFSSISLENRLLQDCAWLCVDNSVRLLSLVYETCGRGTVENSLPWWHRVFYLFVALQHLLAAMLRPDLFNQLVSENWNTALSTLGAHEHLSPAVKRCVSSFQKMAQTLSSLSGGTTDPAAYVTEFPDLDIQAFFQQSGLDTQFAFLDDDKLAWPPSSTHWTV